MDQQEGCDHGPWGGHGMMPWQKPGMGMGGMAMRMGMMGGMCPVCGGPLLKPTKDEMIEMLEKKKKRLQAAMDHLNKEVEKLKSNQEM